MQGDKLTIRYPRKDAEETRVGPSLGAEDPSREGETQTGVPSARGLKLDLRSRGCPANMRLFSGASGADGPQRHKSCRPRGLSLRGTRVGSLNPGSDCSQVDTQPRVQAGPLLRGLEAPVGLQ